MSDVVIILGSEDAGSIRLAQTKTVELRMLTHSGSVSPFRWKRLFGVVYHKT